MFNEEGFLNNIQNWSVKLAEAIALENNISLTPSHWEIINVLRNFYQEHQHIPPTRLFIKKIAEKLGKDKASTLYVCSLFPKEPLKILCKIAGLPKPRHCL